MDASQGVALITAVSSVIGFGLAFLVVRVLRSPDLPSGFDPAAALKFAEGERDRMQGVAKGMAATASGFLVAVLTAMIEGKVGEELSPVTLILVLLGSIGMLLLAAAESRASAQYMAGAIMSHHTATASPQLPGSAGERLKW